MHPKSNGANTFRWGAAKPSVYPRSIASILDHWHAQVGKLQAEANAARPERREVAKEVLERNKEKLKTCFDGATY